MKVKEESEKVGLKLNIQKTKIMTSGPISSWEIDGETVEIVSDFILGDSKITADGDRSHEIKRHLLIGRKLMTNLDNILKPVYLWPIIGMAKPIQYCKVINLQLNKFMLNNKAEILLCQQISV